MIRTGLLAIKSTVVVEDISMAGNEHDAPRKGVQRDFKTK